MKNKKDVFYSLHLTIFLDYNLGKSNIHFRWHISTQSDIKVIFEGNFRPRFDGMGHIVDISDKKRTKIWQILAQKYLKSHILAKISVLKTPNLVFCGLMGLACT